MKKLNILTLLLWTLLSSKSLFAAINVTGAITNESGISIFSGALEITETITFTINTASTTSVQYLVFEDWASPKFGLQSAQSVNSLFVLQYSLNSRPETNVRMNYVFETLTNPGNTFTDITDSSGGLFFEQIPVSNGDIISVLPQSWALTDGGGGAGGNFGPEAFGFFQGSVFLADSIGNRISDVVVVPEPSSALIFGIWALVFVAIRLRKRNIEPVG